MAGLGNFKILVVAAFSSVLIAVAAPASEALGAQLGDLTVLAPWARASAGAGKTGAAYLTIVNRGAAEDSLVAVRSDRARKAALHTHEMVAGVMKMRPIEAIAIAPGGRAELAPGGDHVMLMGLQRPLKKGEDFELELVFERAGTVTVKARVAGVAARSAPTD